MKYQFFKAGIALVALLATFASCENDNINPYDYAAKTDTIKVGNDVTTTLAKYPSGSLVWSHDTTLTASVKVPQGVSLYIEPGVIVTCSSKPSEDHPVEIVVLGNLYCMGTSEKPVVIKSDTGKPADWGGIICGYDSKEVVLQHTEIANAGATPSESSVSYMNKLFKTTIDGGVPAFHFCNTKGKFVIANCYFHDNYNDQTYFTGGRALIYNNIFADSGNAEDGGEAINIKSGCKMEIAYNLIYNACTNAFKLSNSGVDENIKASELSFWNNTAVDCGWRRTKNKKGGSIWLEKGADPVMVNNLVADCRYGLKQPAKDGADLKNSVLSPNYFYASTDKGVKQMARDYSNIIYLDANPISSKAGELDPLFAKFEQNSKMDINCESDNTDDGAPLPYSTSWSFYLGAGSPALSGAATTVKRVFSDELEFFGLEQVVFNNSADAQTYLFTCPAISPYFGAFGQVQ